MIKFFLGNFIIKNLIAFIGVIYILIVFYSSRVKIENKKSLDNFSDNNESFIYAFWHDQLLMCPYTWKSKLKIFILISKHRDGDIISKVISYLGFRAIRGSTNKPEKNKNKGSFIAAKKIVSSLKDNNCVGIAPDGPRGPRHEVTDGIIQIARISKKKILPVAIGFKKKWTLNTWDQFIVPRFFNTIFISWGDSIEVNEKNALNCHSQVKEQLDTLTKRVNSSFNN